MVDLHGCFSVYVCLGWYQAFLGSGCKTLGMRIVCCEAGSLVLETRRVYQ